MQFAPLPVTLRQLQYVLAIDEERSFSRAAERCHVSQPSLSAQLAQVEDALGVQLFERDRRRVLCTPAGEVVVDRARRALLAAADVVGAARALQDPFASQWRLGVIPTISPYLLPQVAPALRETYPELEIVWTEDKTENLVAGIEQGRLDAAIVALEAELGDLERRPLRKDEFVLAVANEHRLAGSRRRVGAEELAREPVLLLDDGHCLRDQALTFCTKSSAQELGFRATSLATLTEMVAGGAGVTLLPVLALPIEARADRVSIRRFKDPAPFRTLGMIWRGGIPLQSALQEVTKTLAKAMR